MKNALILLISISAFISCKSETKAKVKQQTINVDSSEKTAKQSNGLTLLKGEFIYFKDAAILQTHANIYGVFVNDKMQELNTLAEKYKKEPTDMVLVEIRGKITNKKDDTILWENKVEIVEILNVFEPKSEENNVVKLGQ